MASSGYNESKFIELVLHCAQLLANDESGGATKLNKLLYFAEFEAIRTTGSSITGVEFQRLVHGPAPRPLIPIRSRLLREGQAELRQEIDGRGYRQDRLVPRRLADLTMFSAEELATIETVAARLGLLTATEVSELSHQDPGWRLTGHGETIPASSAYLAADAEIPERLRPVVAARAKVLAAEHAARALG